MLQLRFTPIGVDDILEDVQRMYVQERLRTLKVRNKHKGNEPIPKEYEVLVSGTTCLSDQHESHQGPGLALTTCIQCAAMLAKRPEYIDCSFINQIIKLGSLTYDSLINPNKSSIVSLRPILNEHEHLRGGLKLMYENRHLCAQNGDGENENDNEEGDGTKTGNGNEDEKKKTQNDSKTNEDNDMTRIDHEHNIIDEETNRLVNGHIIQASTVQEYLTKLEQVAQKTTKKGRGRRDSSIRFGTALSKAVASNSNTNARPGTGAGKTRGRGAANDTTHSNRILSTVYMGIICTEQLSLTIVVVKGKTKDEDDYLVFDPMKRDGKTDGSETSTIETTAASCSKFDRLDQVASFIARRLSNLDVTQFTFFILSNNR